MLDDPNSLATIDRRGIIGTLSSLPEQLEEGLRISERVELEPREEGRVVVVGMGGSAIAGDIVAAVANRAVGREVLVVRGYDLPAFIRRGDLLILVSYSGDTRETLSVYQQGLHQGCTCLTVSSGGELREVALSRGDPHVSIPTGLPPRGALGYLLAPLLLFATGSSSIRVEAREAIEHLSEIRSKWAPAVPTEDNQAKKLALRLLERTPIVYALSDLYCAAKRWQTQLNENAKVLAWSGALLEASHNEIIGWMEDPRAQDFLPIVLMEGGSEGAIHAEEMVKQMESKIDLQVVEPSEAPFLGRVLELVLLGDMVSVYLAVLRGVDPFPVRPIQQLKEALRKRREGPP
jgi:glucose/mannose-6-phosphate isomerase